MQNAQIGKIGTQPAAVGQMDTQQMAQQWRLKRWQHNARGKW
jgi:hypothetical protein